MLLLVWSKLVSACSRRCAGSAELSTAHSSQKQTLEEWMKFPLNLRFLCVRVTVGADYNTQYASLSPNEQITVSPKPPYLPLS